MLNINNTRMNFSFGGFNCDVIFLPKNKVLESINNQNLYLFDINTYSLFPQLTTKPDNSLHTDIDITDNIGLVSNDRNSSKCRDNINIVLPAGEKEKVWQNIDLVAEKALFDGLARDAYFFGVGGGVICDLTAFLSSLYMRGCNLILVPTTLLAMVDAALGGKTGIDFKGFKNILGTFYPAQEIRICIELINTLPEKEYRNGLAEIIKHALLSGGDLFDCLYTKKERIAARDPEILQYLIHQSIKIKGNYVEQDFREQGIRAHLNLGHTFAHALESITQFSGRSHGEAVAWGIAKALDMGVQMLITDPVYRDNIKDLLIDYGYALDIPGLDPELMLDAIRKDKKKKQNKLRFILQRNLGNTEVVNVDEDTVLKVLYCK